VHCSLAVSIAAQMLCTSSSDHHIIVVQLPASVCVLGCVLTVTVRMTWSDRSTFCNGCNCPSRLVTRHMGNN
jgi:hypothetical protein